MIKRLLLFMLCALPLYAQSAGTVTLTTNLPKYGLFALSGETVMPNVQVSCTGTCAGLINWSIGTGGNFSIPGSNNSGTTQTVTSVSGYPASIITNITAAAGNCTVSGSSGSYTINSTTDVTLTAQSVDDTTKTVTFPIHVCSNTTRVAVGPWYQQAYLGQQVEVWSKVFGNTNQAGTWSATGGTFVDTTRANAVWSATTAGNYTLTFTATAGGSSTLTVHVSATSAPSYSITPNKSRPVPCEADTSTFATTYDVGSGYTYADPTLIPSHTGTALIRLHNAGTTSSNATVYANYIQFFNNGQGICGVPDSSGDLPIMDAANATGNSSVTNIPGNQVTYTVAIIGLWPGGSPNGPYQAGSAGPSNVLISGLHLRNARNSNNLTPPGGGTAVAWDTQAAGIGIASGSNIAIIGNEIDNNSNGIFSAMNQNHGWATLTQNLFTIGNYIHNSGTNGNSLCHQFYDQALFSVVAQNYFGAYTSGALGSVLKVRGIANVVESNYMQSGATRVIDFVENQDASNYTDPIGYLDNLVYSGGDTLGLNGVIGLQAALYSDTATGNILDGSTAGTDIHYRADHDGGVSERLGTLHYYLNTLVSSGQLFGVGDGQNGGSQYYTPIIDNEDNISYGGAVAMGDYAWLTTQNVTNLYSPGVIYIPAAANPVTSWYVSSNNAVFFTTNQLINNYGAGVTLSGFGSSGSFWNGTTNAVLYGGAGGDGTNVQFPYTLANTGTITESTASALPRIMGSAYAGANYGGWPNSGYYGYRWTGTIPLDTHQLGLKPANFLTTSTPPYNSTTFVASGAAVGAATALSGVNALLPPRYQIDPSTGIVTSRNDLTTLGARDTGGAVTLTAISLSNIIITVPGSPSGVTRQAVATCYYSNGTNANCSSTVTWSTSGSGFSVNSTGLLTATSFGVGTITATSGSVSTTLPAGVIAFVSGGVW